MSDRTKTAISLYTGAGGLDLGFEAAGFETAVAVEWDQRCVETLRHNRNWLVLHRDIHDVSPMELLTAADLSPGCATILIGGPPCQPFSKSGFWATGDSRRLQDPRASTLEAYLNVLETALPSCFLLENVAGIAFKGKSEGIEYLERKLNDINRRQGTKYSLEAHRLNAARFGVPQLRERMFVVGHRDGSTLGPLEPTHFVQQSATEGELALEHLLPCPTAWDAIGHLKPSDVESLKLRGKWADLLPSIPEGQNYLFHTERGDGEPLFGWRRRFWNFLLKLAKDRPSWTLTAQPGPATGPFHWDNRHLSAEELCALQTFPNDYEVLGNRAEVQKQVGNAVPSALAEFLALKIRSRFLSDNSAEQKSPSLLPNATSGDTPRARRPARVPAKYLPLAGDHAAHPGTGKGYGALRLRQSG